VFCVQLKTLTAAPQKNHGRVSPAVSFFAGLRLIYSSGTISSATMLMILISGFTAGPAVSL
jgi:hypothetical protein